MRVLILGGTGFCGAHLARLCLDHGEEVFIAGRSRPHWQASSCQFIKVDITIPETIKTAVLKSRPDRIYHLAGMASVGRSFEQEEAVYQINVLGTFHVLKAIKQYCPFARVLVVGSAEEYGRVPLDQLPIKETTTLQPISPYGVSRVASTLMSLRESDRYQQDGLHLVATRTFNLTGPGQSESYVCSDFAKQMARAVLTGHKELTLTTGNINVKRDFSSVNDGMLAYRDLIEKGQSGHVYNVCSGHGIRISEIIQLLGDISGLKIRTEIDPKRLRNLEVQEVKGDPQFLMKTTGLHPGSLKPALDRLFKGWVASLSQNLC